MIYEHDHLRDYMINFVKPANPDYFNCNKVKVMNTEWYMNNMLCLNELKNELKKLWNPALLKTDI